MRSDARVLAERYELRQRLGGGAMGEVWLGFDLLEGRFVAIKVIQPLLADARDREEFHERFDREAELLKRLKHPGIPAFLDAQKDPDAGGPYLVMEYVIGQDLTEILKERGHLPVQKVVSIGIQICDVLEHTHAIPVIHRDLKPANIMLASEQRVMVLDFGVAKMFRKDQARLTKDDRVLGTVAYMPPEQCLGGEVNPRSDLYSLACTLYELLTGKPPFPGDNAMQVMYGHVNRPPNRVRLLRLEVNSTLEDLIMAGLEKQACNRPANAQEFRNDSARCPRNRLLRMRRPPFPATYRGK